MYWNHWEANEINNQSITNILVDWVWASGVHKIKISRRILSIKDDEIVGIKTLSALNDYPIQIAANYGIR